MRVVGLPQEIFSKVPNKDLPRKRWDLPVYTENELLILLDKLKKNGQAILCTIHQPSAMLFQRFDRLLFLKKGGQTVYYGDVGENSKILIDYFVRNGGPACPPEANPAEWMLEVIGAAPGSHTDIDWYQVWRNSPEYAEVQRHLAELKSERGQMEALQRTISAQKREDEKLDTSPRKRSVASNIHGDSEMEAGDVAQVSQFNQSGNRNYSFMYSIAVIPTTIKTNSRAENETKVR